MKGGEFCGVTNSKRKPDADAPMPALLPGMGGVDIDRSGFPAPILYVKLFSPYAKVFSGVALTRRNRGGKNVNFQEHQKLYAFNS